MRMSIMLWDGPYKLVHELCEGSVEDSYNATSYRFEALILIQ